MKQSTIYIIDCERDEWVVVRLDRLGKDAVRYVLSIQEVRGGLAITAKRQLEGDSLIGGDPCSIEFI